MRVFELFDSPVRTVAVSPDGRFLAAAAADGRLAVVDWFSGDIVVRGPMSSLPGQIAFTPDGEWLLFMLRRGLHRMATAPQQSPEPVKSQAYSGGVAVAPDGKSLVATGTGLRGAVAADRWELPSFRAITGFDYWSPFTRLAFSPSGEFIAGIDADTVELRIAVTGGLNGRHRTRLRGDGFMAFPHDSQTLVFGWWKEFHVMETRAGQVVKRVVAPVVPFADAAFLGTGAQLGTVDRSPVLRLWSAESWEVVREYDWEAGNLTCVTTTADGLAGVCGTDSGRLVLFDVDE